MGIKPEHPQLLASFAAMPGHGTDRPDPQAMITAQHDRQASRGQLGMHGLVHPLVPGHHLGQVAVAMEGTLPGVAWPAEVAAVDDLQPVAVQHGGDACHA